MLFPYDKDALDESCSYKGPGGVRCLYHYICGLLPELDEWDWDTENQYLDSPDCASIVVDCGKR